MKKALFVLGLLFVLVCALVGAVIGFAHFRHNRAILAEETFIRAKISEIGFERLRSDADEARRTHDTKKNDWVFPKSSWPASFRAFNPVEVLVWDGQVFIVTSRHMQHRCGLIIGFASYGGGVISVKIADGFYYERS